MIIYNRKKNECDKLKLLTNCEREVKENKLTTKKTTKTDEAIRIAKQTRSYKKQYLVTLNPFLPPSML